MQPIVRLQPRGDREHRRLERHQAALDKLAASEIDTEIAAYAARMIPPPRRLIRLAVSTGHHSHCR
jgi:hypothetical protein